MKKLLVIALVIMIFLTACGPSDAICNGAWYQMDVAPGQGNLAMNMILNSEWPPDSVGHTLKECVEHGWTGYR